MVGCRVCAQLASGVVACAQKQCLFGRGLEQLFGRLGSAEEPDLWQKSQTAATYPSRTLARQVPSHSCEEMQHTRM